MRTHSDDEIVRTHAKDAVNAALVPFMASNAPKPVE